MAEKERLLDLGAIKILMDTSGLIQPQLEKMKADDGGEPKPQCNPQCVQCLAGCTSCQSGKSLGG